MRILITNLKLNSRTGTELATRDLSLGLKKAGHEVAVYSPEPGEIAEEIRRGGVAVTDHLDGIAQAPDIIHGHHYVQTMQALVRFPAVPALFVVHDPHAWHDVPPLSPQIRRYVAVDMNCFARLADHYMVPADRIRVIHNAFDPERFPRRKHPPGKPSRALVFSNYAGPGTFVEPIREACAGLGIPLDFIGSGMNNTHADPGRILHDYDLVFATGRCAVEASAAGAAIIVCSTQGLGPFVTVENLERLFGKDYPYVPPTRELIVAEIQKITPDAVAALTDYIRTTRSFPEWLAGYEAVYREVIADPAPQGCDLFAGTMQATACHFEKLEHGALAAEGTSFSVRIPGDISSHLSFRLADCPREVSGPFAATVELENNSTITLSSAPPLPVAFSYHWLSARGRMVEREGLRTNLPAPLPPGRKATYTVRIDPPPKGGRYLLRFTMVQDSVAWLDALDPPLAAETTVTVRKENPLAAAIKRLTGRG